MEILAPLLSCSELQVLEICSNHFHGLDDLVLENVGRALPHLTRLEFDVIEPTATVTYRGLHALATRCPQLTRVYIPLDVTAIDINDLQSPQRRLTPCTSLQEIWLCDRWIPPSDPPIVAAVIHATFPSLELFSEYELADARLLDLLDLFSLDRPQPEAS